MAFTTVPLSEEPGEVAGIFIHDHSHPHVAVVHVFGEATFADATALATLIAGTVRTGQPFVLDMRECNYMDCATIGVIVRAAKTLGDRLRVVIPRGTQAYRILELTGLTNVLHIFESFEAASGEAREYPRLRSV
jgi:anti-anti-sigma factor